MPEIKPEKFYPRDQAEGLREQAKKFPLPTAAAENIPSRPSPAEEKLKEILAKKERDLNKSLPKN